MFKKILSYSTVALSALLFVAAIVDLLAGSIDLFAMLFSRLAVIAMVFVSLGLTALVCLSADLRKPLMLTACLLQSPFGGAMAILLVYDLCFPDQIDLGALLPLAVILVAFASVIHGVVVLLCMSMEAEKAVENSASSQEDSPESVAADGEGNPSAQSQESQSENEDAPLSPTVTPVAVPKARSAMKEKVSGQDLVAAKMASRSRKSSVAMIDDELSPVPKKKHREEAPAKKPSEPSAPAPVVPEPPAYTDLFELLSQEVGTDVSTHAAESVQAQEEAATADGSATTDSAADRSAADGSAGPVWEKELPEAFFTLPKVKLDEEAVEDLTSSDARDLPEKDDAEQ